jgi:hypothetical protein
MIRQNFNDKYYENSRNPYLNKVYDSLKKKFNIGYLMNLENES